MEKNRKYKNKLEENGLTITKADKGKTMVIFITDKNKHNT
jgi:hypothetical protein